MREAIQSRGRLAGHPLWARVLASTELSARTVLPVVVSSAVEDREKLEGVPWLERLSLTEVVREARAASVAGLAGLLLLGASERKDEHALLASEPDHALPRAIRANPVVEVPADVLLVSRTMGLLSGLGKTLDSQVDLFTTIMPYAQRLMMLQASNALGTLSVAPAAK